MRDHYGFTLIELLVVIGILVLLLAITLVALNPARQFSQSNNTKRASDVNAILNTINQYTIDNRGKVPAGLSTTAQAIGKSSLDLCSLLVPTYIAALPVDPLTNGGVGITNCTSSYTTNYDALMSTTNNRVTVIAPATELSVPTIAVSR